MTRPRQKRRERFYAEACARQLGESWEIGEDFERPDFIVMHSGQKFGLEVCELFSGPIAGAGSKRRQQESARHKRIQEIRREYESLASGTPLNVRLVGDVSEANLTRVVPDLLAADLVNKPPRHRLVIDNDEGLRVHVRRSLRPDWIYIGDRAGWIDQKPLPKIEQAVERKSRALKAYRESAGDDVRLMLYANPILNSGKLKLVDGATIDRRGFTVVYFFTYLDSVVVL